MKKTPSQDTQLIRQLEELYDEPDMRRGRLWWRNEFWPESASDYLRVEAALGTPENAWLGHMVSYWGMAAALVLNGTLSEQAVLDAAFSDEMFEVFCKVQPILKMLRKSTRKPGLLQNIERFINGSKQARQRLAMMLKRSVICRKDTSERLARAC